MSSKCLICLANLNSNLSPVTGNISENYIKIVQIFCKFFCREFVIGNGKNEWDFDTEILPFCPKCSDLMVTLCTLDERVTGLEQEIQKIIAKITKEIIESDFSNQNQDNCLESSTPDLKINLTSPFNQKHSNVFQGEPSHGKIFKIRRTIVKNHCPVVVLPKLNRNIPQSCPSRSMCPDDDYFEMADSFDCPEYQDDVDVDNGQKPEVPLINRIRKEESHQVIYLDKWPVKKLKDEFLCLTCKNRTNSHNDMFQHVKDFHGVFRKVSCTICQLEFETPNDFKLHHNDLHSKLTLTGVVFPCGSGQFLYNEKWFFYETEQGFQCYSCGHETSDQATMLTHLTQHEDEKEDELIYPCLYCSESFRNRSSRSKHVKDVHPQGPKREMCYYCGLYFDSETELNNHYTSNICGHTKEAPSRPSWLKLRRLRGEKRRQLMEKSQGHVFNCFGHWPVKQIQNFCLCRTCGTTKVNMDAMYIHIKHEHEATRKLSCGLCKNEVGNEAEFIRHLTSAHSEVTLKGQVIACGRDKFLYDGQWFYYKHRGKFQCIECCQECQDEFSLLEHLTSHKGKAHQLTCDSCDLTFSSVKDKSSHNEQFHQIKVTAMECRACGKSFKSGLLKNHQSRGPCHQFLKKNKSFKCSLCPMELNSVYRFVRHTTRHHPEILFPTDLVDCGDGNVLFDGRWLFVKMTNSDKFQCHFCGERSLQNLEEMKQHIAKHPCLSCDICGRICKTKKSLNIHKEHAHHDVGQNRFLVGRSRSRYYDLVTSNEEGETFKCYACPLIGQTHVEMRQHLEENHKPRKIKRIETKVQSMRRASSFFDDVCKTGQGQYVYNGKWTYTRDANGMFNCSNCDLTLKIHRNMVIHIKSVHDDPTGFSFVCEECGKGYHNERFFKEHQGSHIKERSHQCPQCEATFQTGPRLKIHIRLSHGTKMLLCDQCPKSFTSTTAYNRHLGTHSDVKAFKCPLCPKTYKQRTALARHKRSHVNERPYQCSQCSRGFSQKHCLRKHIQVVHVEGRKGRAVPVKKQGESSQSKAVIETRQEFGNQSGIGDHQYPGEEEPMEFQQSEQRLFLN